MLEIYDAVNVNISVWAKFKRVVQNKKGKQSQSQNTGSISTVCYSDSLDIIAYAGVSGKIFIIDQTTKNQIGTIEAHKFEIVYL